MASNRVRGSWPMPVNWPMTSRLTVPCMRDHARMAPANVKANENHALRIRAKVHQAITDMIRMADGVVDVRTGTEVREVGVAKASRLHRPSLLF